MISMLKTLMRAKGTPLASTLSLLTVCTALGLTAPSAMAADLLLRGTMPDAPFAAPEVKFDWSGAYIGASAGGIFSHSSGAKTTGTPAFLTLVPTFAPGSLDTTKSGFIGGGQLGYNVQNGGLVFGAEADISFTDQKRTTSFTGAVIPGLATAITTTAATDLKYLATLRGRIGVTPTDHLLIYATGGLAFGDVRTSGSVVADANPALRWDGQTSKTQVGWALGAGGEFALTQNITLRGEYLYYDLGSVTTSALGNAAVRGVAALDGIDYITKTNINGSVVRAAVNYKF
jgi:outer membrane immunogenic protein